MPSMISIHAPSSSLSIFHSVTIQKLSKKKFFKKLSKKFLIPPNKHPNYHTKKKQSSQFKDVKNDCWI